MKTLPRTRFLFAIFAALLMLNCDRAEKSPNSTQPDIRKAGVAVPRRDAFFGLHFDLHPQKTDTALSADITEEMVARVLQRVKPDYVQYDCKGHAGYTGYPTKVGWPSPGIAKDGLAIWRKVTRQYGVGLFIHYSGVWDSKAIEEHPEWACIDAHGKRDVNATSVFGPYIDRLLIPQLREVSAAYDLDGLWVDGECWAAQLDYSPAALQAWRQSSGFRDAPKGPLEPNWLEWKMFHRRAFEDYLCRWVDSLHVSHPQLQITSNWMYTVLAPKPVKANLDFLSGDYSPSLSVDRARVDARYLSSTGMPWDLMAWGFDKGKNLNWSIKSALHLQQEAAVVLMQGGGFQIYHTPTRNGYICDEIIDQEAQVAEFCRARQTICHKSTTVPQVALLLSSESMWDESDRLFSPSGNCLDRMEGTLHALLELHYSVDILAEHQLLPKMSEYPLIVLPDSKKLTDEFKAALLAYVRQGGQLVLMGERSSRLFESDLGVRFIDAPAEITAELAAPSGPVNVNGVWQKVELTSAQAIGYHFPSRDRRQSGRIAASITPYGNGQIAAIYGPLGQIFFRCHHPFLRQFIGTVMQKLFPGPKVRIDAPAYVELALRRTAAGRMNLHLFNRANLPIPDRYNFIDAIPAIGPIKIEMSLPEKPSQVIWQPEGRSLSWSWRNGKLETTVPSLQVHGVVVF